VSEPLPDDFESAIWLPFELDGPSDRVALVRFDEAAYLAAPFLDQRALGPAPEVRIHEWSDIAAAISPKWRRDAQYIFHIGHVGSTLISRLLGEIDNVLALREPLLLRAVAEQLGRWDDRNARVDAANALLSRTFRPGQRAIVKATSFVSEIAADLLPEGSRALLLALSPRSYIETILAGENSVSALPQATPGRAERLGRCIPEAASLLPASGDDPAMQAALGWACEASALEAAAARIGEDRVLRMDFDAFLEAPAQSLSDVADFYGLALAPERSRAIVSGPLMRRYSKALEFPYSPQLRHDLLAEAGRCHREDIERSLSWLAEVGAQAPAVAVALQNWQERS